MHVDVKGVALLVAVVGVLVVGAYSLGLQQGDEEGRLPAGASRAQGMPPGHPAMPDGGPQAAGRVGKFNHFRVGNSNVKGMVADGNLVWVGTSIGVIRYDLETDDYRLFDVASGSLLSNGVFHVSKLGGRIAVGTYGGGMSLYDPAEDQWRNYNIPDGLADQFVYDVVAAADGDVWIATWSGVNRVEGGELDDPAHWTTYNVKNTDGGLPNDWVYAAEQAPDGALWFATEQGVARFKDGRWTHWQHDDGVGAPYEQVKDELQFSRDPGQASQHHARQKHEQGLDRVNAAYNPNYIVSLAVTGDGTVWAGTWGGGLARFDGEAWRNYTVADGLPSDHVFMLYKDPKGRLWAGTSHGLARFDGDDQGFTVLTRRDGLFADNVFSMAYAKDGSVWVGSFGGVARLLDGSAL